MRNVWVGLIFFLALDLAANPAGVTVEAGSAHLTPNGNLLQIETSDVAILNWKSFSIQSQETLQFLQPSINSAVLNRVTGSDLSELMGQLRANGQVYLINPNGIVIGKDAVINTAALFASTLDVQNGEFLSGKSLNFSGTSVGKIENLGTIHSATGPVCLLARHVENRGKIDAPHVSIGAGSEFLVQPRGATKMFIRPDSDSTLTNEGVIESLVVELQSDGASALAINQNGLVKAKMILREGGKVFLRSPQGTTEVSGGIDAPRGTVHLLGEAVQLVGEARIDASSSEGGGTILVGGDFQGKNPEVQNARIVWTGADTHLLADGLEDAPGGKIILWGDEANFQYGTISSTGGDGGLVEISGRHLEFRGRVDTSASLGKTGTLLLDPTDIVIDSIVMPTTGSFSTCPPSPIDYQPDMTTSNYIYIPDLITQLGLCNVVIQATGDGVTNGTITVNNDIDWSATTNDLTLRTSGPNSSVILGGLMTSGQGNLNVSAEGVTVASMQYGLQVTNSLTTGSGNFTLTTNGNVYVSGPLGGMTLTSNNGAISISSTDPGASMRLGDGRDTITAGGGTVTFYSAGSINIFGPLITGNADTILNTMGIIQTLDTITQNSGELHLATTGNIDLRNPLNRGVGAGLTSLVAGGNIRLNTDLDLSMGSGDVTMNAGVDLISNNNLTTAGNTTITVGRNLLMSSLLLTNNSGNLLFTVGGDILFPALTLITVTAGDITFNAGGDLSIYSAINPPFMPTGGAGTLHLTAAGDVNIAGLFYATVNTSASSGGDIFISSPVFDAGTVNLTCLSGVDFIVPTSVPITSSTGNLTFVVDTNAGSTVGPGIFNIADSCTITSSGGGGVSFYAAEPLVNFFPPVINGAPLSEGFVACDVVYPGGVFQAPFSVFFKSCANAAALGIPLDIAAALASLLNSPSNKKSPYKGDKSITKTSAPCQGR